MTLANFVIAGTEKAGTTSVYSYLVQHPQVVGSRRKETNFFRAAEDPGDAAAYAACFPEAGGVPVVMEASPGYLGEAQTVVPRMRALIPQVKLLFILRDPVERFLSSYHFHRSRLNLPRELTLGEYVDLCLAYAGEAGNGAGPGTADGGRPEMEEWFLKVLPFGCYAVHLRPYFEAFPQERIRVAFYDELRADPRRFMERLSAFLEIDASFWAAADFKPMNVTFSGRSRLLHRLAVLVNDRLEPVLRPRPRLKSAVVDAYKRLNGAGEGYDGIAGADRQRLEAYYAPYNRDLEKLLGTRLPPGWVTDTSQPAGAWQSVERRAATS